MDAGEGGMTTAAPHVAFIVTDNVRNETTCTNLGHGFSTKTDESNGFPIAVAHTPTVHWLERG